MTPEAQVMDPDDLSGEDAKLDVIVHKDRVGADPTEGWRRGARGELRKSCDTCTASKTKCCGGIPCDRCKKRNLICKFSKRRRCGPKARPVEEKRARTGPSKDIGIGEAHGPGSINFSSNSGGMSPPRYAPSPVPPGFALQNGQQPFQLSGSSLPLLPSPSHRPAPVFEAPLTADGLSGLVGIIAPTPTLSDGGGSGSSGASEEFSASFRPLSPRHTMQKHLPPKEAPHYQQPGTPGIPSVMVDSNSSPNRVVAMAPLTSTTIAPMEQHSGVSDLSSIPPVSHQQAEPRPAVAHWPFLDDQGRSRNASQGPSSPPLKPSADLVRPSHSLEDAPVSVPIMDASQDGNMAEAAPVRRASSLKIRGPLPMDPLPVAARLHLATFLKSIGSLLPLPGIESLREALAGGEAGCQDEDMTDVASPAEGSVRASGVLGSARLEKIEDSMEEDAGVDAGAAIEDPPRDRTLIGNDELRVPGVQSKIDPTAPSLESATTMNPLPHVGKAGDLRMRDGGDAILGLELGSGFDEACRAEAWAAIAVGALFGGLPREDAAPYAMRSLQALPRCVDAPLPEVASAFLLHALFWLHSMEKQKVARYFGFAQQVGIELGVLMPDGLRHSLAFMSVLVNMALGPEKALSLGVAVRDPVSWGVCTSDPPGVDPRIGALGSVAVACSKMLEKTKGQVKPFGNVLKATDPAMCPAQSLVEMLERAQEGLRGQHGSDPDGSMGTLSDDVPMEHLVALVSGLKAYVYARRGEPTKAEAAARFALGVIERDPGILHLPLTFSLADASKRIVELAGGGACGLQGLSRIPDTLNTCNGNPGPKGENGVDQMRANVGLAGTESGVDIAGMDTSPTRVGLLREGDMASSEVVATGAISRPNPIGAGIWCSFGSGGIAGASTAGSSPKGLGRKTEDSSSDVTSTMNGSSTVGMDTGNKTSKSPSRASSMTPPPELGRSEKKISRAERMSRKWKPSSVGHMNSPSILLSTDPERSAKSNHPTTVGRTRSLDGHFSMGSRWPLVSGSVSPRVESGADAPTDWMQRIRSLAPRSPSPGIVGRMAGGRSTPPCDPIESDAVALGTGGGSDAGRPASSANRNPLGPMPVHHPPQSPRHASEPSGLALLSGVAAPSPAFRSAPPCLTSVESGGQAGEKRGDAKRVPGGGGTVGVGGVKVNHHAAGAANGTRDGVANVPPATAADSDDDDADLDEPPLPSPRLAMSSQVSFDPNREDSTLHEYIFPSISRS